MKLSKIQNLFNFANNGLPFKEINPTQYDIDRELIKNTLPDIKWKKEKRKYLWGDKEFEIDVIDFDSFFDEITKKYSKYKFEKKVIKYEKFTYFGLIVRNVFNSKDYEDLQVGFYESEIANLLRAFDEIEKNEIRLVKGYRGFQHSNNIEIGILINKNRTIYSNFEKSNNINYNLKFEDKDIDISIGSASITYKSLFTNILFNTSRFSIRINNFISKSDNSISNFLDKIEIALNLKLYKDYSDMIEFSKYIPKRLNPSKSDTFYVKPIKKDIDINLRLNYLSPILVTYMQNTLRTDFIPFRFLSYYHIIEFYFIESYEKHIKDKYDKITKLNYEEISKLLDVANKLRDEEKMLELVLRSYIELTEFKKSFNIKQTIPQNKISNEIILPSITVKNENDFYSTLSKRIYTLRNAIVHSKSRKSKSKPLFFVKNDDGLVSALYIEIRLIKWIAEKIIESNINNID